VSGGARVPTHSVSKVDPKTGFVQLLPVYSVSGIKLEFMHAVQALYKLSYIPSHGERFLRKTSHSRFSVLKRK
jgi:DNA mismatch repair protein MutH